MRRLLSVVLILVVTSATPALARKWTSRAGGFSVEAELVDVRDGNAVLKKEDGAEISVPLSKLSLADIRYVDGVLKGAEAGLGMKPDGNTGPAAANAGQPTSPPKAGVASPARPEATATRPGAATHPMRYDWKPGQRFTYRMETAVQLGTGAEEIHGNVSYTVKSVSPEGVAEITFLESITRLKNGGAIRSTPSYSPSYRLPPRPPSRSRYSPRYTIPSIPAAPDVVKVDRYGRIISTEGGAHFPLFLGRAAHLPFEPLSTIEENPWSVATDIAFRLNSVDWLSMSTLGSLRSEELLGREKATFTLDGSDVRQVTVNKTYEASSAALVDGRPQIAMSGEGKLTFDPQRGLFSSLKMKVRVAMHEGAVRVEVPIQVSYELVSEAEEARMMAAAEKSRLEAEKLAKDLMRPLTVADLDEIVKDLQSGDYMKELRAKTRLTTKRGQEPDPKLATAVERLLKYENSHVREAAAGAFTAWATKENVPMLVKLLDSDSSTVRGEALQALGRLKATSAIDRIVQQLPQDQFTAAQALRSMGPAAEPAVLKLLTQGDRKAREEACQILNEIGTKKSLFALEKAKKDGDALMKIYADQAIKAIERRQ
jgi:hypothetical protein